MSRKKPSNNCVKVSQKSRKRIKILSTSSSVQTCRQKMIQRSLRAIVGKYRVIIGCTRSDLLFKKGVTDEATIGISNGLKRPHYETIYIKANQFSLNIFNNASTLRKKLLSFFSFLIHATQHALFLLFYIIINSQIYMTIDYYQIVII